MPQPKHQAGDRLQRGPRELKQSRLGEKRKVEKRMLIFKLPKKRKERISGTKKRV